MADWHVSDSDSDEEDKSIPEFSIVRIDRAKVLELLEAVEKRKTLELECLCRVARKEHPKANGRSCRKRVASPVDRRSGEEVSETASVRSTHTAASTSMECRDMRKPTLAAFDYQHEEEFSVLTSFTSTRKRRLPFRRDHGKNRCVARLGTIEAEIRREKEKQQQNGHNDEFETPSYIAATKCSWSDETRQPATKKSKLDLSFEDNDSDSDSQTSDLDSLTAQLNRVEKILDGEGFT